jgi:uncharacterized membrane protein
MYWQQKHILQRLALKLQRAQKVEKSLMDLQRIRKLTESKMEGQVMLPLYALIRKNSIKMPPTSCGEEGSLI